MRKTIFAFIFAIMFGMAIGSCGNGTATCTSADSVVADTVDTITVTDTVADSIVVAE